MAASAISGIFTCFNRLKWMFFQSDTNSEIEQKVEETALSKIETMQNSNEVGVSSTVLRSEDGIRVIVNPDIPVENDPEVVYRFGRVDGHALRLPETVTIAPIQHAHGLIAAVHKSYCRHLPLVLKPDHLMITVMQALSGAIRQEPESFASALGVLDSQKREIDIRTLELDPDRIFDLFRNALTEAFGDRLTGQACCNFSTSCMATMNVANIALMNAYSPYTAFQINFLCGIPVVHLLGTEDDWKLLITKITNISKIFPSLDWWFCKLIPVAQEIASLWHKHPDRQFWDSFYGYKDCCASGMVPGHINAFFPYVHHEHAYVDLADVFVKNPWFENKLTPEGKRVYSDVTHFPKMISVIPIKTNSATMKSLTAHAALAATEIVFDNGIMPVCTWKITDESETVIASGSEDILGNNLNNREVI